MVVAAVEDGAEKPHYHGHRQRLRARFLESGPGSLADYELLELLLFSARPRQDVKPLAKSLIAKFGSFAAVIQAEPADLLAADGLGETGAVLLKAVAAVIERVLKAEIRDRPLISSWQQLLDYCGAVMGHATVESFRLLFLDTKNALIADEVQQKGTVDHTPVYPREVVRRALELGASAFIMVHNHPSGDPTPSAADIDMTREVARAVAVLGIRLHDHLVIGRGGRHASLKSLGLI
jgi:DNA repair protein RadC